MEALRKTDSGSASTSGLFRWKNFGGPARAMRELPPCRGTGPPDRNGSDSPTLPISSSLRGRVAESVNDCRSPECRAVRCVSGTARAAGSSHRGSSGNHRVWCMGLDSTLLRPEGAGFPRGSFCAGNLGICPVRDKEKLSLRRIPFLCSVVPVYHAWEALGSRGSSDSWGDELPAFAIDTTQRVIFTISSGVGDFDSRPRCSPEM